jgi:hypothetical protein
LLLSKPWLRNALLFITTLSCFILVLRTADLGAITSSFRRIDPASAAIAAAALAVGFLLSCWRLKLAASDLGYPMSARDAIAAASLGQVGGSLFFQVVGQTIARSAVLHRRGVPVAGTIVLTGYERLAAVMVSFTLALASSLYLFGGITWDTRTGGATFAKILLGCLVAVWAGAAVAWGGAATRFLHDMAGSRAYLRIARVLCLSSAIQITTMAAYVSIAFAINAQASFGEVAAATGVVMLAASLPISFAGWGIRELSAVYALGFIGFKNEDALVVAIAVGAAALAITLVVAAVSAIWIFKSNPSGSIAAPTATPIDYLSALGYVVPIATVTAVFFQLYVPLSTAHLNVNLADPMVIVGAVAFATIWIQRGRWPVWRLGHLNRHIVVATGLLLASFIHGCTVFGWTDWAFVNRMIGWFILLAYGATGALIVATAGESGFTLLLRTFVAVGLAVLTLDASFFTLIAAGVRLPPEIVNYRLEGFAENPNAFALQILLIIAAIVGFREARARTIVLALAVLGLCLSGSRAGWVALAAVALASLRFRVLKLSQYLVAIAVAGVAMVVIAWLPEIIRASAQLLLKAFGSGAVVTLDDVSPFANAASRYAKGDDERMTTFAGAWDLLRAHPIFGAGLGAFIYDHTLRYGQPLVIHSTALWLAAELGVVGLIAFVAPFIRIFLQEAVSGGSRDPARIVLILLLVAFGVMSLAHDIFYQRAVWVLLGASLACTAEARSRFSLAAGGTRDVRSSKQMDLVSASD